MPTNKITGNKLADMMYGNPEGAAFGFFPQMGRRGQNKPPRGPQPQQMIVDDRAMELPQSGDFDLSVPSAANKALGERILDRDIDLKRQADQDMSPLEKLAGGMQAGRLIGSGLVQAVKSIPTAITQGGKAAEDYIAKNIYQPNVPKAYEYAGDVSDFLTSLETDYKIPPIMPEALALQFLAGPATKQAGKAAKSGALDAAMRLERGLEPIVNRALEGGGLPRKMVEAMGANTQSNVIKPKDGNFLTKSVQDSLARLKQRGNITGGGRADPRQSMAEMAATYTPEKLAYMSPETQADVARSMQDLEHKIALNDWVDGNLTNYVKKQMATPDDPVRKLAEEGITHNQEFMTPLAQMGTDSYMRSMREKAGFPREGLAQSRLAKTWENLSDEAISTVRAGDIQAAPEKLRLMQESLSRLRIAEANLDANLEAKLTEKGLSQQEIAQMIKHLPDEQKATIAQDSEFTKARLDYNAKRGNVDDTETKLALENPWISKLDPETPLYEGHTYGLGFDHIIDVLREDLTTGRIRPEQLNKVSIERAVRRTAEYDQELADKMNAAKAAQREGLPVYKEYPEGFRWVELNKPGSFASESESMGHSVRGYEPPKGHPDWTEASGDSGSLGYGHGGWEAIKSGKAKVYSLVDSKGAPHTTVEVAQVPHPISTSSRGDNFPELSGFEYGGKYSPESPYKPNQEQLQQIHSRAKELWSTQGIGRRNEIDRFYQQAAGEVLGPMPQKITQIKGKGNAAPNKEYLPFVQDFVKSGQWSEVGDLRNTGLRDVQKTPKIAEYLKNKGVDVPRYLSETDYGKYENDFLMDSLYPKDTPPPGMAHGGRVHISNDPDVMQLELAGGGAVAKLAKLARAPAKTRQQVEAIAERVAPQVTGEYVRKDAKSAKTVADKTQKQFQREKTLPVDIRPNAPERIPETLDIEKMKGDVMIGVAGDPTATAKTLYGVGDYRLESPSPQHGGPLYGLYNDNAFWASGLSPATGVQNLARRAGEQYDAPVKGMYVMMGPDSINYAQHFADANLQAIDLSRMTKGQVEQFNNLIRQGSPKSGPRASFTGIEDKGEAYLQMAMDPELRKHFNALMQQNTVTERLNLPNGNDIRFAITEPSLRDLETGVTGYSIGRMRPDIPSTALERSTHPTYDYDIPGEFLGQSKYPMPYELSFPDTLKSVQETPKQAKQEFGSLKMVGPRQTVDQQLIDEIRAYEERMKILTGKKEGGSVQFTDDPVAMQLELAGGGLVKKIAKAAVKGTQDVLPAVERDANLQKFLSKSQVTGPVFHAAKADVKQFSPKHRTELSSMGHHFGTAEQANTRTGQYDFESQAPNVGKYHLNVENPLEVSHMASYAPDHLADTMMDMGMLTPEKYDALSAKHRYDDLELGGELVKVLKKNGYDGLKYSNEMEGEGFSYVPFQPTQIKSSTGNRGTYDINEPDLNKAKGGAVSFSDDPDTMRLELAGGGLVKSAAKAAGKGLFSAVNRTAQNLKRPAGTGKEFMAEIKASPGIKATELKGRKLAEIEALPKMTKDQFIKELEARPPVKIEEKVLGQPSQKEIDELADKLAYDKSVESARYYGEHGDDIDALAEENYLFNIRNNLEEFREEARQSLIDEGQGGPFHEDYTIPGGKNYREILLKAPAANGEGFLGTPAHFGGEPNILASIRVSDRMVPQPPEFRYFAVNKKSGFPSQDFATPEELDAYIKTLPPQIQESLVVKQQIAKPPQKVLHVEEIQSDWHQAGRKKGYGPKMDKSVEAYYETKDGQRIPIGFGKTKEEAEASIDIGWKNLVDIKYENIERKIGEGVPDAPFKKDWHELGSAQGNARGC
jgi:hypothetical protein